MKISIRPATQADAGAISLISREIQALHAAALPWHFRPDSDETFSPAELSEILEQPNNLILIAEADSVPAGYAYAAFVRRIESTLTYHHRQLYLHHFGVTEAQLNTSPSAEVPLLRPLSDRHHAACHFRREAA